jgi:hypothetical protein
MQFLHTEYAIKSVENLFKKKYSLGERQVVFKFTSLLNLAEHCSAFFLI